MEGPKVCYWNAILKEDVNFTGMKTDMKHKYISGQLPEKYI